MRGFDTAQVQGFLTKVTRELGVAFEDYQETKKTLKKTEVELQEYKEREDLLKRTLATATQMSDKMKVDSDREAKLIVSDAHHKAEMITRDAKDSLRKIYQDISELRRVRLQFENNLKAILASHMSMMEQGQRTIPDPIVDDVKLKRDLADLKPETMNLPDDGDTVGSRSETIDL
jgi:cell division initiation protein